MSQQNRNKYLNANPTQAPQGEEATPEEAMVRMDGFKQVLEMLRIADPEFRESLLRRLGAKDKELARALRADLADL